MKVLHIGSGQIGDIPDNKFDTNLFQKVDKSGKPIKPSQVTKIAGDIASGVGNAVSTAANFLVPRAKQQLFDTPMAIGGMAIDYGKYKLGDEATKKQAIIDYNKNKQVAEKGTQSMGFSGPGGTIDPVDFAKQTTQSAAELAPYLMPGVGEVKGAGLLKQTPRMLGGALRGATAYYGKAGADKFNPVDAALTTALGSAGEVLVPKVMEEGGKKLKEFGANLMGRRFKFDVPNKDWLSKRQELEKVVMEQTKSITPEGISAEIMGNKNPFTGKNTEGLIGPSRKAVRDAVALADESLGLSAGNKVNYIDEKALRKTLEEEVKKQLGMPKGSEIVPTSEEGMAFAKHFSQILDQDPDITGKGMSLKKMLGGMFDIGEKTRFHTMGPAKDNVADDIGKAMYFKLRDIITKQVNEKTGVDIGTLMGKNYNYKLINEAVKELATSHAHAGGISRETVLANTGLGSIVGDIGTAFNRAVYNTGKIGEQGLKNPFLRTLYTGKLGEAAGSTNSGQGK